MNKKQKQSRDDPEQSKLFIKKAKEIEADEGQSAADALLGHLQHKPPEPRTPKAKRRSTHKGSGA